MKRTFERATNDAKKREVIEILLNLWKANPSLRLGQLIENAYHPGGMLIIEEDFDLLSVLKEFYK